MIPKVSYDLGTALCDFLRDREYLDEIIKLFISPDSCEPSQFICLIWRSINVLLFLVRMAAGLVLEESMSLNNRDYVINKVIFCALLKWLISFCSLAELLEEDHSRGSNDDDKDTGAAAHNDEFVRELLQAQQHHFSIVSLIDDGWRLQST